MTFKVTILGSGSALPVAGKHHSAHALNVHEQFYLIDCGEGTQTRLSKYGISPMKLRAVFITHLHGDHIYGLFPLLSTMSMLGRKTPLKIFAPAPFAEIMACNQKYFAEEYPYEIQYHEVNTRVHELIFENKVMEVWTIPLRHRVPASGFLFREKTPPLNVRKEAIEKYGLTISQILDIKGGKDIVIEGNQVTNDKLSYIPYSPRSYAYISDTNYSGKAVSLVHGIDLLYHEATFSAEDKSLAKETGHSTSTDAAKAAVNSGAKKLIIGHFSGRNKNTSKLVEEARTLFPETYEAVEGETFLIKPSEYGKSF